MKKLISIAVAVLGSASFAAADTFVNGNFENGTLYGWTQGAGALVDSQTTNNLNAKDFLPGGAQYDISYNASAVVSPGKDPNTDNNLNMVYSGSYSARVNDSNPNYSVSVLSQTVNNYSDSHIYFAWAAVLESSHGPTDSDIFQINLVDNTTGKNLFNVTYNSATAPAGLFTQSSSDWYYTQWQVENLDVSANQGDSFTLTLLGSDCPYGGHAGYVYLDGFGGVAPPPVNPTPEPATMSLMGLSAAGLAFYLRKRRAA